MSTMVEATLKFDPFNRNLFCFVNNRRNQIKVLHWQHSGFCLWLKRLKEEKFKWPTHLPPFEYADEKWASEAQTRSVTARPPVMTLSEEQFLSLLKGLDLKHLI